MQGLPDSKVALADRDELATDGFEMDQQSLDYYNRSAAAVSERYRSVASGNWAQLLKDVFPAGGRLLDVGCGSGRDLALLLSMGYEAHGTEPSDGLRAEALRAFPQIADRLFSFGLPLPENGDLGAPYDGIICSAVLMHVPEAELFDAAFSLKRALREKGKLWISISGHRPDLDATGRDETGRLFGQLHPDYVVMLFERLGFQLLQRGDEPDRLGRPEIQWHTFLFELDSSGGRPLDRIERVLNRDQKDATYKLALFRALSELGTQQSHRIEWLAGHEVAVPMGLIAEKWFRYYWPLFAESGDQFIPQKNGESQGCAKPVAFRRQLTEIIAAYRDRGGLAGFLVDEKSGQLQPAVQKCYRETLRCIGTTIKNGPVVFTSGNIFRYDSARRAVVVEAGAWREFCGLGHWIEPAVVLRWAEETSRMSKLRLQVSDVLDHLLIKPTEERDVGAAKTVFEELPDKRCVWTDKILRNGYAVDHLIPFSLWHCNDLWNLMPADARVNGAKSDQLPARSLLFRRKDAIVFYWEKMRARHEQRFVNELRNLTAAASGSQSWQNAAFGNLTQAVETTASLRGVRRWEP